MPSSIALLRLLQLCNSSLPVGAYSYSDGLETLCNQGIIGTDQALFDWLLAELQHGSIAIEATVMLRAYRHKTDRKMLKSWNDWYTATREAEELRLQSLQMGRSLIRLLQNVDAEFELPGVDPRECNYCIAFGGAAAHWQVDEQDAALGYIQSWIVNLVNAGVKLIPLGQTQGQQIILDLAEAIAQCTEHVMTWQDEDIASNSWGIQIASMRHETLYSRIFRS